MTVVFDPDKISQEIIDKLKLWLQNAAAEALSSPLTLPPDHQDEDIVTRLEEIYVGQHEVHPTDVNPAPFEVYIQAGRPKMRSGDMIVKLLAKAISATGWIPNEYLGEGQSCIFLVFHENNGFAFIPRSD